MAVMKSRVDWGPRLLVGPDSVALESRPSQSLKQTDSLNGLYRVRRSCTHSNIIKHYPISEQKAALYLFIKGSS